MMRDLWLKRHFLHPERSCHVRDQLSSTVPDQFGLRLGSHRSAEFPGFVSCASFKARKSRWHLGRDARAAAESARGPRRVRAEP